jgi:hypothetical protein
VLQPIARVEGGLEQENDTDETQRNSREQMLPTCSWNQQARSKATNSGEV